jgi:quercetin dioxygenase-like cupin family protein
MKTQATFLPAGTGETFSMMGITMTVKQSAQQSNGLISVIEQTAQPGAGSPLHQCGKEDKLIYVLEGTFAIQLGDEIMHAPVGSTAAIPRGVAHNFKNIGPEPGKVLVVLTPGGHEYFLQELSQCVVAGNREVAPSIAQKHAVTFC